MAMWTALVLVALWWLLRGDSQPAILIVHEGEALKPAAAEKVRAWFKADPGLQRIYPWILFGPYTALVAWCFPLERGRLRLNVALNLVACAAFLFASHALNARVRSVGGKVMIFNSQHHFISSDPGTGTNMTYIKIVKSEAPDLFEEEVADTLGSNALGAVNPAPPPGAFSGHSITQSAAGYGPSPRTLPRPGGTPKFSLLSLVLDLLAYCAILGATHSIHFYRRFRERERRALILESGLATARLSALRAQLQPHFLFNSLNAIAALLRRDPRLAEAALMSLSDLLRLALSQSERQQVSLREELILVQRYLEIQQTRFGDKLRIEQQIEPATLDCQVPTLVLQPLVENAVRHGLEPAETPGLVRLSARQSGQKLVLCVEDNGIGLKKPIDDPEAQRGSVPGSTLTEPIRVQIPSTNGNGIGLKNLQARLQMLFREGQKLQLSPRPEGGTIARIEIPWRTTGPEGMNISAEQL
jgi:anti-sigma regulatory factor (Ser/Thr protein kinase)